MDPKVCGKLLTTHRRGYGVDVESLRDRFPLRQIAGKGPRLDLTGTEGCGGGQVVSWLFVMFLGYKSIYIRERRTSVELRGAHEVGARLPPWARPPPSWALVAPPTNFFLLYIYSYTPKTSRSTTKPISTAATFCTQEIPSWSLFRSFAGGDIDHGGLLHQHHSLSDDV